MLVLDWVCSGAALSCFDEGKDSRAHEPGSPGNGKTGEASTFSTGVHGSGLYHDTRDWPPHRISDLVMTRETCAASLREVLAMLDDDSKTSDHVNEAYTRHHACAKEAREGRGPTYYLERLAALRLDVDAARDALEPLLHPLKQACDREEARARKDAPPGLKKDGRHKKKQALLRHLESTRPADDAFKGGLLLHVDGGTKPVLQTLLADWARDAQPRRKKRAEDAFLAACLAGAALDAADPAGFVPLILATALGAARLVYILLVLGVSYRQPSPGGFEPLNYIAQHTPSGREEAVETGRVDIFRLLLRKMAQDGTLAKIARNRTSGLTALHYCVISSQLDLLADALACDAFRDRSVLDARSDAGGANRARDVDARHATSHTPLHKAIYYKNDRAVELLLAAGADPAITNEVGKSANDIAAVEQHAGAGGLLRSMSNVSPSPRTLRRDIRPRANSLPTEQPARPRANSLPADSPSTPSATSTTSTTSASSTPAAAATAAAPPPSPRANLLRRAASALTGLRPRTVSQGGSFDTVAARGPQKVHFPDDCPASPTPPAESPRTALRRTRSAAQKVHFPDDEPTSPPQESPRAALRRSMAGRTANKQPSPEKAAASESPRSALLRRAANRRSDAFPDAAATAVPPQATMLRRAASARVAHMAAGGAPDGPASPASDVSPAASPTAAESPGMTPERVARLLTNYN